MKKIREGLFTEFFAQHPENQRLEVEVLDALAVLLEIELRKRTILRKSPGLLGFRDCERWDEATLKSAAFPAMRYFLKRINGVMAKIAAGESLLGYMRNMMSWFVSDMQRRADPVGTKVYNNLDAALKLGVEDGRLSVDPDDGGRPGDHTTVRIGKGRSAARAPGAGQLLEALAAQSGWDSLLAVLHKQSFKTQEALVERLGALGSAGFQAVSFKVLVDDLKGAVRKRLAASETGPPIEVSFDALTTPPTDARVGDPLVILEHQQAPRSLRDRVRSEIERCEDYTPKVKEGLLRTLEVMYVATNNGISSMTKYQLGDVLELAPNTAWDYRKRLGELLLRLGFGRDG